MSNFSILMSIYYKEDNQHFNRAMQSIWDEQTVKPNEIILVKDVPMPLPEALCKSINIWQEKLGKVLKVVLHEGVGIGPAKHLGIKHCTNELIAVMDTDDIALPDRFEQQLQVFENNDIDVCGTWVSEFENDESYIISYRRVPEFHNEIIVFAKSRNPISHPTVMYKKSAVLKAGNYSKYKRNEDYNLFVKLIMSGAKFYNIQKPLVNMRIGNGQVENRRSSWGNIVSLFIMHKEFYKIGFLNFYELIKNISILFLVLTLPKVLVKKIYKLIRKL